MGFWKDLFKKKLPDGMVVEPIQKDSRPPTQEELRRARQSFEQTKEILEKEGPEYQRQLREVKNQQQRLGSLNKHLDWQGQKLDQLHDEAKDLVKQADLASQRAKAESQRAKAESQRAKAESQRAKACLNEYDSVKQAYLELKSIDPNYKTKLSDLKQRAEKLRARYKLETGEDYDIWSELTEPPNLSEKGS